VVLAHLLKNAEFNFSLAHCNFNLRGKDSANDEKFCLELAKRLNVPFFSIKFDTEKYRRKNKLSVQMAARELRYKWFDELIEKQNFDFVLTAHNANDVIETFFINLLRGTGINGLKGIPRVKDKTVRPLLDFKKEEIIGFAKRNKIKYRLDKSNLEDKYERNFLRLNVIPLLKQLNPKLEETFLNNIARFKEENSVIEEYYELKKAKIVSEKKAVIFLDKDLLKKEKNILSFLNYLLSPYGFNASQAGDIKNNILKNGLPGKKFYSPEYILAINRTNISIKKNGADFERININSIEELKKLKFLKVETVYTFILPKKNELVVDPSTFVFPLTIRKKITGDKLKPFGMKGFKLVSDLLKDEKLDSFEKENIKSLVNGNKDIIWVMGLRSDERYKVTKEKNNFLKLTLLE